MPPTIYRPTGQPTPAVTNRAPTATAIKRLGGIAIASALRRKPLKFYKGRSSFFTFKGQLRSMAVGLACGAAVLLSFMFVLFNELVVVPFIHPADNNVQAPVVDDSDVPVDPAPKITIPKINARIPVIYDVASTKEVDVDKALEGGIIHYPTTILPGQKGNTVFFGHSSNNIFNPGRYKFAFVLLHEMTISDKFYLTYNSTLYTYQVIDRKIVKPNDFGVLDPIDGQVATASLITCDPPGTSRNRLVVVGAQISPDPTNNNAPPAGKTNIPLPTDILPGNGPSLWDRMWNALF
jgi:LPXTG-site transpeptidase (sortase) family protein